MRLSRPTTFGGACPSSRRRAPADWRWGYGQPRCRAALVAQRLSWAHWGENLPTSVGFWAIARARPTANGSRSVTANPGKISKPLISLADFSAPVMAHEFTESEGDLDGARKDLASIEAKSESLGAPCGPISGSTAPVGWRRSCRRSSGQSALRG
jgi:hypothetical protein